MPSLRHLRFSCLLAGLISRLFLFGGLWLPNRAAAQINAPSGAIHPRRQDRILGIDFE